MKNTIVITRHTALVAYLREIGLIDDTTPIIPHCSDPEQIRGKIVIGPIPLHLAAHAECIINIPLKLDQGDRGRELSLEEVRARAGKPERYMVRRILAVAPEVQHCGVGKCGCGYRSYGSGHPDASTQFGSGDCYCDCIDCAG